MFDLSSTTASENLHKNTAEHEDSSFKIRKTVGKVSDYVRSSYTTTTKIASTTIDRIWKFFK